MKKHLPDVTLITVDCRYLPRSLACADICEREFTFAKTIILSSMQSDDPRVVYIPEINSGPLYSEFYSKELHKYVETPLALTFHHDGFIANPEAWDDEFLKYDYIGAPWCHPGANNVVGNGGFAIRSKRLMQYLAEHYDEIGGPYEPEDLWSCQTARPHLEKASMTFAPTELAKRWSKEGNEKGVVWNDEFGWHSIRSTDMSKWFEKNPEYKEIFSQKLDDYTQFMTRYPVYDGTVHVLSCKPVQVEKYKKLSSQESEYDCRMDTDLERLDPVKPGHTIIYRLWRILLSQVGIPTFERTVEKIERFSSKKELLSAHPNIQITPSFYLPQWKQRLLPLLGNILFPNKKSYSLFWYTTK